MLKQLQAILNAIESTHICPDGTFGNLKELLQPTDVGLRVKQVATGRTSSSTLVLRYEDMLLYVDYMSDGRVFNFCAAEIFVSGLTYNYYANSQECVIQNYPSNDIDECQSTLKQILDGVSKRC